VLACGNDTSKRYECAAGAARALPGCGWQVVHAALAAVFSLQHKLHAPSPVASPDARKRRRYSESIDEGMGNVCAPASSSAARQGSTPGPATLNTPRLAAAAGCDGRASARARVLVPLSLSPRFVLPPC
jgi:hypothetical protein